MFLQRYIIAPCCNGLASRPLKAKVTVRISVGQLGFNHLNMQYSGWIISYHDMQTKERFFKGPFCMCDLAQDCARKLKKQYTAVKIYHLVYEECDQV